MTKKPTPHRPLDQIAKEARTQLATLYELQRHLPPDAELLRRTAEQYVKLNHEWQKARWGRVRKPISVASLLR
jgi:hypothetical protein